MGLVLQSKQELGHKRTKAYYSCSCPLLLLALVLVLVGRKKKKLTQMISRCHMDMTNSDARCLHSLISRRRQLHPIVDYSSTSLLVYEKRKIKTTTLVLPIDDARDEENQDRREIGSRAEQGPCTSLHCTLHSVEGLSVSTAVGVGSSSASTTFVLAPHFPCSPPPSP
jgi:hypothetical protein